MGSKGGQTTKQRLPKEFRAAYTESLGMARDAINQPYTPYGGQLVAGLNPMQQQGMEAISNAQGVSRPYYDQATDYTQQAAQGITPELYDRFYSPYVRDVADTTFANLMESNAQQRSGLKSGAIQAGAFGGDRGGVAQSELARQQNLANASSMANIYDQGYGKAMTLAGQQVSNLGAMGQQMAGLGAGRQSSELQGAQAMLAGGAQQQQTEQAKLQAAYDQWMQQQSYPYQQAQFFANIAQGLGSTAGGNTTTPGPSAASQIIGGIGALGSLASGAGSMMNPSDERVKENIEPVGTLDDGQTIYRYNFKGDPKTQIGLIAQEVEKRNPDAVGEIGGIKMVNYKDATEDAANSMGGVVAPSMERQGLAGGGGVPYFPYMTANTFVPEGKMGGGGGNFPSAYKAPGLGEDWKKIDPLTQDQASGLKDIVGKAKLAFSKPNPSGLGMVGEMPDAANAPTFESNAMPDFSSKTEDPYKFQFASGGVAGGRNHYADGGLEYGLMPEDDPNAMSNAIDEANPAPSPEAPAVGLAGIPRLLRNESGGNFGALNSKGYAGRGQFGAARLEDARRAGVLPEGMDAEAFRKNPDVQKAVENWHFNDINNFIDKNGLGSAEGRLIDGVTITRQGLINVAHLGGAEGLARFVATNGGYDPADANGTHLSDYLAMGDPNAPGKAGNTSSGVDVVPASEDIPASSSGVAPSVDGAAGLSGAETIPAKGEPPHSRFNLSKLFASDTNPSLIESVIGRRLSPEARSAVLNASFALMAGQSPFFGVNLGEAGKVGTQTYYNALAQKRATEKMRADIGLEQQGRDIERYGAETSRLNIARQIYNSMLPQIKFWRMQNPGQPLPPEYARVVSEAYPSGNMPTVSQVPSMGAAPAPSAAPAVTSAQPQTGTQPQASAMPAATGEESVSPGEPPAQPVTAKMPIVSNQAAALFNQLPDEQNPLKIMEMAQGAQTVEDYMSAVKLAQEMISNYQDKGIPLPGGVVAYPGTYEMQAQKDLTKLQTEGAYKATSDQTERSQRTIENYQTTKNTLDQAANKLATTETGQFEDTKAYLSTALKSLGLNSDADSLEQATGTQELKKIFSQILFAGGLKDKIGSQIAATELQMFSRGFGDVNLEPAVNRFIVGTMRGILDMENKRARDWVGFVDKRGDDTPLSRREVTQWEINWNDQNPVSNFVEPAVANTPVMGEIDYSDPTSREKAKPGWKYALPNGKIATFTGEKFETGE